MSMHTFLDVGPGLRSSDGTPIQLFVETPAQEGYDPMLRGFRSYGGDLGVLNL